MKKLLAVLSLFVLLSGTAHATLLNRGGGLIYDTNLNITWLQNANLSLTQVFGLPTKDFADSSFKFGIAPNGAMNFNTASSWIVAMNAEIYLGYSDWRLPTTMQPDPTCSFQGTRSSGVNCTGSEMGNLFYSGLGNPFLAVDPITNNVIPSGLETQTGPFQNLQINLYWSSTEYVPDSSNYFFSFFNGQQGDYQGPYVNMFVMAVRDGDVAVAAVPEPETWALLLAGLGLISRTLRKKVSS